MSQLTGDLMLVKPIVVDFGWGNLESALNKVPNSGVVAQSKAATQRRDLVNQYIATFRKVEVGAYDDAKKALKDLATNISAWVAPASHPDLNKLVDGQMARLSSARPG